MHLIKLDSNSAYTKKPDIAAKLLTFGIRGNERNKISGKGENSHKHFGDEFKIFTRIIRRGLSMIKKSRVVAMLLVLLLSVSLALSGCSTAKPTTPAATEVKEAKIINIGWSGPLSGGAAQYGQDTVEGLKMAIDETNDKGGITIAGQKYTFKLVTLDDQYQPNLTATNAHRLKTEYNCPIIFTPHSGGIFALQEFNEKEGFLIGAYSSEPKITERGNKLTLRIPPPYDAYVEPFSKVTMEKFGKKVALVPGTHQYAKDWSAVFIPAWEKAGGTVVNQSPVDYNKETDFFTYVSKALAAKPDVLFVGGASKPTAMVVKQARQLGFKGGFIIMDQAKLEQMEQTVPLTELNGAVGVIPVGQYPGTGTPGFMSRFKAKFNNKIPVWEQAWHYGTMLAVVKGIEKAQNVDDPTKIFEGMKNAMPIKGDPMPVDFTSISDKGGLVGEGMGVMVEDGKYGKPIIITQK